jgi:hypothetical protein
LKVTDLVVPLVALTVETKELMLVEKKVHQLVELFVGLWVEPSVDMSDDCWVVKLVFLSV